MGKCYDKFWLYRDMDNMAYIFEYCEVYCNEIYGVKHIDKIKFLDAFMRSRFRKEMEQGQPRFLSQAAYDSIKMWVDVDYNKDLTPFIVQEEQMFREKQLYWIGWIYAFIHYKSKLSSKTIVNKLPIEDMLNRYYLGHEMSKETFYNHIKDGLKTKDNRV